MLAGDSLIFERDNNLLSCRYKPLHNRLPIFVHPTADKGIFDAVVNGGSPISCPITKVSIQLSIKTPKRAFNVIDMKSTLMRQFLPLVANHHKKSPSISMAPKTPFQGDLAKIPIVNR